MDKKQMKDAFDEFNPTENRVDEMWQKISETKGMETQKSKRKFGKNVRYVAAAVAGILVISLSGVGLSVGANEKLLSFLKEAVGISDSHQDIVEKTVDIKNRGIEVFASDIMYIDDRWLVFGNLRGILIYDLEKEQVKATIDTQAIDCMYFDGESKQTHVIKKNDSLIIFNSQNGVPYGSYYQFNFKGAEEIMLTPSVTGKDKKTLDTYYRKWKKGEENYVDTFDLFMKNANNEKLLESKDEVMYSQRSIKWKNDSGIEKISCLIVENNQYSLKTYQNKNSVVSTKKLNLPQIAAEEGTKDTLPEFVYTGEDRKVKAICEYLKLEKQSWMNYGEVWIPAFIIHKQVVKNNEVLVFGSFWSYSYLQSGNILETVGGGDMPACFHLKQDKETYKVISVDIPRDGGYLWEDIKKMTKGYPGVYEKFLNCTSNEEAEVERNEFLQMYVKESGIDVKYYKDHGWDPVEIFE